MGVRQKRNILDGAAIWRTVSETLSVHWRGRRDPWLWRKDNDCLHYEHGRRSDGHLEKVTLWDSWRRQSKSVWSILSILNELSTQNSTCPRICHLKFYPICFSSWPDGNRREHTQGACEPIVFSSFLSKTRNELFSTEVRKRVKVNLTFWPRLKCCSLLVRKVTRDVWWIQHLTDTRRTRTIQSLASMIWHQLFIMKILKHVTFEKLHCFVHN